MLNDHSRLLCVNVLYTFYTKFIKPKTNLKQMNSSLKHLNTELEELKAKLNYLNNILTRHWLRRGRAFNVPFSELSQ